MRKELDTGLVPNHAYVIDPDYRLVSIDQETHRLFPKAQIGDYCYESLRGLSQICDDCPWKERITSGINQAVVFNHLLNSWVDLSYMTLEWPDHGSCILINGRGIDQNPDLLLLFDKQMRYDKLSEVNITKNTINRLFLDQEKYIDFPPLDTISETIEKGADTFIHPDDRETYLSLWNTDTLQELYKENRSAQEEYRRKLVDGGWGWVSQVAIPLKREQDDDVVFMFFMVDVDEERKSPDGNTKNSKDYLNQLLERDSLTGLYTSQAFFDRAEVMLHDNHDTAYEVLYIDIEHFKIFNERYGRDAGDLVLKSIANELLDLKKAYTGLVGYIGGDDFMIILPQGTTDHENIVDRLSKAINKPDYDVECLPAIGVAAIHDLSVPVSTYCDHAMTAMTVAKGRYSSRIAWYEDTMTRRLEEEPKALTEIEQAIKNKEFILHYQPKCNLRTGQMVGLEALVRWQHPTKGLVFPGAFIPLLERTGLIANLDLLVWEEACRQTREWLDAGIPTLPISVNISRADLQFVDVANSLESFIKKYNIDRSFLELEITESAFVEDDAVIDAVIDLKERGFTLLMDDFGSGYSSLNMLKNIPVDILKIDMRFLELSENVLSRGESILDAVVSMAHTMGLSVIAEGAETEEQVEFLKSINCDFVQGYYFYRPLPVESLEALLGQENIIDYLGANRKQVELLSPVDLIQNYVTNKTILDSILGGIAIYGVSPDGDLELIQANNRYFQLVGDNPPKDEEDRLDFFRRAPKEVIEETVGLLRESEKHPVLGAEDEFCQRRADGLFIWVKVKAFFLTKEGDRSIYFGRLTDISVQKDQEDVLRASEDALTEALGLLPAHGEKSAADDKNVREALAAFVRNLPGALLGLANRDNYPVLFSNNEVAFILGYVSYRDFMEHTMAGFRSLIHPNDLEQFDNYLISEQHNSTRALLKLRLKRKSGTFVSIYAQCRVINRDDGRSLLMLNLINIEKVGSTTIVNLQDS